MDIIYQAFAFLLGGIFKLTGDWGIAIILLTLGIRVLLLPLSIKQRVAMEKQQEAFRKIEEVKEKLKHQKEKMEREVARLMKESTKGMLGCLLTLLQLPVMYPLYQLFMKTPEATTVILPWLTSLKAPDPYFVIPALTMIIQMMPNIMVTFGVLKTMHIPKVSWGQVLMMAIFGALFFAKAPAALGIYWAVSGICGTLEQIGYVLFRRKQFVA